MNKNTAIAVFLALVVLAGGYLLLKNKRMAPVVNQTSTTNNTYQTPPGTNSVSTPGAPIVETSSNTGPSSSSAIVTGQVNPNGASTTYWFDYGETTAFGARSSEQGVGSGYALVAAPAYITGLKQNTLYYFRLSAKNRFATVNGATYSFETNNNPPPQAFAPTVRTTLATGVSQTSANINGQVDPNSSPTAYWFEYGTDNSLGTVTALQSAGSADTPMNVSVSLSGLEPLTKYYFRINAQNQYGTVNGAITSFNTTGPAASSEPAASTIAATSITSSGATLNGRVDPNGAETTYHFEYSTSSLLATLIGSGTPEKKVDANAGMTNVAAAVTGLQPYTTYYYRIVARNSHGTVRGNILSFTTKSN